MSQANRQVTTPCTLLEQLSDQQLVLLSTAVKDFRLAEESARQARIADIEAILEDLRYTPGDVQRFSEACDAIHRLSRRISAARSSFRHSRTIHRRDLVEPDLAELYDQLSKT